MTAGRGGPRVWDAATGKSLLHLRGSAQAVQTATYSADGARIVTSSWEEATARIWDAGNGECLTMLKPRFLPELFRRRRPEWWWGIFWLKEFWATVVFGSLLIWSLWRDRKYFRALDANQAE